MNIMHAPAESKEPSPGKTALQPLDQMPLPSRTAGACLKTESRVSFGIRLLARHLFGGRPERLPADEKQ